MKRGEIWWANVDKRRPVILLSRSEAYDVRALIIIAPVTTVVRGFAAELKVGRAEGLPQSGVVNCDWITTIPKVDLIERAGVLSKTKMVQLQNALMFVLGLE
jgi:mRNA interferase MazF